MTQTLDPAPDSAAPAAASVVALPTRLTPAEAGPLADQLLAVVNAGELALDGAAVETVGLAGLQVLVALVKSRADRPIRWQAPSAALLAAARDTGLNAALLLPSPPSGPVA